MNSDKVAAQGIGFALKEKGIQHVVLCPGSRNAPIISVLSSDAYFNCYSIVDERSAGFFAIGMAQYLKDTVAVVCTSGSAVLNLAPSVVEAYYQRIPLLIISADRPKEWVNQGESQTFDQGAVFSNYVRKSFDLVQEPNSQNESWFFHRQLSEAINTTRHPFYGPVHINVRFDEPLYEKGDGYVRENLIDEYEISKNLSQPLQERIAKDWSEAENVLILCGQMQPDQNLENELKKLSAKNVVVLTESTSNLYDSSFFHCIDKVIMSASDHEKKQLKPDLLISIGGPLISRKIKNYFRDWGIDKHWHIDPLDHYMDAFKMQSLAIQMDACSFLSEITTLAEKSSNYKSEWNNVNDQREAAHEIFFKDIPFCDLSAIAAINDFIPEHDTFQIGNSSVVRYVQLMNRTNKTKHYGNRGVSGIEGSVSTAVGYNALSKENTYLVVGDLSMMYDSNGLWNNYINEHLKIIVINNGGGGIFRIIDGPSSLEKFEEYIETERTHDFKSLANTYGLSHFLANDMDSLNRGLNNLAASQKAAILEVQTPQKENAQILKKYFEHLKPEK